MSHRRLGVAGVKVSEFGLGGWLTFGGTLGDTEDTSRIIREAFEAGTNFFDLADVYARGEAEKVMGRTLAELPRHRLIISSKCFWPMSDDINDRGLSRKHVTESVEKADTRRVLIVPVPFTFPDTFHWLAVIPAGWVGPATESKSMTDESKRKSPWKPM